MEAKIKIKKWVNGEPWSHGMVTLGNGKVFTFHMKHFEHPSQFGIDDGRISKLDVRTEATGKPVIHFDRGWDIPPRTSVHNGCPRAASGLHASTAWAHSMCSTIQSRCGAASGMPA